MGNCEVLFVEVTVMELKRSMITAVAAVFTSPTFVSNAQLLEAALALNGLFIHARLAVRRRPLFSATFVELLK